MSKFIGYEDNAKHFLHSAAARTLSLRSIYKDGEEAASAKFCVMRRIDGEPVCPDCGCCEVYNISTRRKPHLAFVPVGVKLDREGGVTGGDAGHEIDQMGAGKAVKRRHFGTGDLGGRGDWLAMACMKPTISG